MVVPDIVISEGDIEGEFVNVQNGADWGDLQFDVVQEEGGTKQEPPITDNLLFPCNSNSWMASSLSNVVEGKLPCRFRFAKFK